MHRKLVLLLLREAEPDRVVKFPVGDMINWKKKTSGIVCLDNFVLKVNCDCEVIFVNFIKFNLTGFA